jgi:hypothetical protein
VEVARHPKQRSFASTLLDGVDKLRGVGFEVRVELPFLLLTSVRIKILGYPSTCREPGLEAGCLPRLDRTSSARSNNGDDSDSGARLNLPLASRMGLALPSRSVCGIAGPPGKRALIVYGNPDSSWPYRSSISRLVDL